MNKRTVVALLGLVCLMSASPARSEQRARSWEVSPFVGVANGSRELGGDLVPAAGLRLGYNINRWWEVELAYTVLPDVDVLYQAGDGLVGSQDEFGRGVWAQSPVYAFGGSDSGMLDLNVLVSTRPVKRRVTFYGTAGFGGSEFNGSLNQQQVDKAFAEGPRPTRDAFDFNDNGEITDLVDTFRCDTCDLRFDDPNDPLIIRDDLEAEPPFIGCEDPYDLSCYEVIENVPLRSFVATDRELSRDSSQWNFGGGMRVQMTDAMTLRLDLRNIMGAENYTAQILSAGLSFRFGGEPPIDDDGDGVPTFRDTCPDTPAGATVDSKGCPSDGDDDQVLDGLDDCPATPAGWPVDDKGCPTDVDGDGVPDGRDTCADTPAGAVVDFEGCPVDSDGDGAWDGLDDCPNTPTGARIDERGCALDEDGDGVPDGLDKCEGTPSGLPVDADGCPIDSDGDGLKDDVDECPAFAGPGGVDEEGCPRLRLDKTVRIPLPQATFAFGSSVLTDEGKEELGALVAAMNFYDDLTIEVEGHTDDVGSERDNFLISVDRARSVQRFLRDQGIDPERISTRGYGETRPVADNTTAEGRAKNRRIEVLVTGTYEAESADAESGSDDAAAAEATAGGDDV